MNATFPPSQDPSAPQGKGRGIKPLVSLKAHKKLALALAIAVGILGIPVAWVKGKPRYYAEAVIHVSPRFVKNLEEDVEQQLQSNSQYREFVQQQVRTINRYDIVLDALKALHKEKNPGAGDAEIHQSFVRAVQGSLAIRPVSDTYLVTVGMEGDRPEGLAETVNAVVNVYLHKQKEETLYASDERVRNLEEEHRRLLADVTQKVDRRMKISQEIGVTTFSEGFSNPFDQLLIDRKGSLAAATQGRIQAEASLASVDEAERKGGGLALKATTQEQVDREPGISSLKSSLNQRRSELYSKLVGLGPRHPGRQAIERELKELEAEEDSATVRRSQAAQSALLEQRRAAVYEARRVEDRLGQEVTAQADRARWFATLYHEALSLGSELDRDRKRLSSIEDRIDFLTLEAKAPGFVRLSSAAERPVTPFKGGRKRIVLLFLFAGVALGLAAPLGIDLLDPRIHTPSDLERILGFPPLGFVLKRVDRPTVEFAADQLRRLASGLNQERLRNGTRVLLLTAAKPGGGTTTLALELARELADIGSRTLALEVNAYKPDPRYAPSGHPGLVDLLARDAGPEETILPAGEGLPDRMGLGLHAGGLRRRGPEARTVLIVDTVEARVRTMEKVLERSGYRPIPATQWADVVKALEAETPDLVLLNPRIATGGGERPLDLLRRRANAVPVVLLTEEPGGGEVPGSADVEGVLPVPCTASRLAEEVDLVLRFSSPVDPSARVGNQALLPRRGRSLPDIHRLRAVLEELSARYDAIVLDAPPILLSADTEILVGMAQATLLVVSAGDVNRGEVRRAARLLERLAPPVAGAILNRVQVYRGGGYFGDLLREFQTGEKSRPSSIF